MKATKTALVPLLLRRDDVCHLVGMSISSIERLIARNEFPAPVQIGARSVAWRREAVEQWAAGLPPSTLATPNRGKR